MYGHVSLYIYIERERGQDVNIRMHKCMLETTYLAVVNLKQF